MEVKWMRTGQKRWKLLCGQEVSLTWIFQSQTTECISHRLTSIFLYEWSEWVDESSKRGGNFFVAPGIECGRPGFSSLLPFVVPSILGIPLSSLFSPKVWDFQFSSKVFVSCSFLILILGILALVVQRWHAPEINSKVTHISMFHFHEPSLVRNKWAVGAFGKKIKIIFPVLWPQSLLPTPPFDNVHFAYWKSTLFKY